MTLRISLRLVSFFFAYALAAVLAAPSLHADTVEMTNGDKLTGTAIKLEGGKLTFKTAYADAIAITWEQVTKLTTVQPFILPTPKGNLSVTSVERTATGLIVATASGPSTMDPAAVTSRPAAPISSSIRVRTLLPVFSAISTSTLSSISRNIIR